jgi:o-succinylbenzoate synthase
VIAVRIVASRLTRFRAPFISARGALTERRGLWLELMPESAATPREGRVGYGEASPLPGHSPDDLEACERALTGVHQRLHPLVGERPFEAVVRALEPLGLRAVPAARFALETALLDLWSKHREQSIAVSLGGARPYSTVPVNGLLVASGDAADLERRACALLEQGIRVLKIKLCARDDAAFTRELEALSSLRRALPPSIELRLDANGLYRLDEAPRRLRALAPLRPAFVEQPVPARDLEHLGPCDAPWAADESLADPATAARLLDSGVCSAFILKPAVLGLLGAYSLAIRAEERGLGVVITHLFDGPIAHAAACELALALPAPPLACGLDRPGDLGLPPSIPIPHLATPGLVTASGRAGLGLSLPSPPPWTA